MILKLVYENGAGKQVYQETIQPDGAGAPAATNANSNQAASGASNANQSAAPANANQAATSNGNK